MSNSAWEDSQDYSRNSTMLVGTYLGLTKEDLISSYGHPFNKLSDEAQLAASLEARTQDLLAKFAPPPTSAGESARMLSGTRSAADGALNELTGSYGHMVEDGVLQLLEAHEDPEAVAIAISTLHEATATMVITDLERLCDVIGLLMIVGSAESRSAAAAAQVAKAAKIAKSKPAGRHPDALSLQNPMHNYGSVAAKDRHIVSDAAKRHRQNGPR